jgi:hypothetical protein
MPHECLVKPREPSQKKFAATQYVASTQRRRHNTKLMYEVPELVDKARKSYEVLLYKKKSTGYSWTTNHPRW